MQTFSSISALRDFLAPVRREGLTIGFIPTMGALHAGHGSLVRKAREECDQVVVSVFVNPTQFGAGEDFQRYPRDLEADSRLVAELGADALFAPAVQEVYPPGPPAYVEVPDLARRWEGEIRPGHFRGVCTVCARLFNIVQPDFAYFGRKDYQQLKIIERMVRDLAFPLTIAPCETVRMSDGLALSSRNTYLNPQERAAAPAIHRALESARSAARSGNRDGRGLEQLMRSILAVEPLMSVDYAAVVDAETLEPISTLETPAVALIAARIGATRLIDNMLLY